MNRRNALVAMGGFLGLPTLLKAEEAPKKTFICPRTERYHAYDKLLEDGDLRNQFEEEVWLACNKIFNLPEFKLYYVGMGLTLTYAIVHEVAKYGDTFYEKIVDTEFLENYGCIHPISDALRKIPVSSIYRIETIKGKLLEFQQSSTGPNYAVIANNTIDNNVIRFKPESIFHIKYETIKGFYPYGVSPLEAIRMKKTKEFRLPECFGPLLFNMHLVFIFAYCMKNFKFCRL